LTDPASVLRARRVDLAAQRESLAGELAGIRSAKGESSADDEHDPEGSTLSSDWSRISGLQAGISLQEAEVARALDRVAAGTYGQCENCGRPIGAPRLEARPAAALCIDCAS
jgi:DnaK suppressor protein